MDSDDLDPLTMSPGQRERIYGKNANIVQYMDYQANPVKDNSSYVPELVLGILQPLEVNEIMEDPVADQIIAQLNVEDLLSEAEQSTKKLDDQFADPVDKVSKEEMSKRQFAPSTKKATWAGWIFEQWKCICNFKLKHKGGVNLEEIIDRTLMTMDIPTLADVLSSFLIEIRKQNGDKYPHETLYKIVLSLQHFMAINGCDIHLLDHLGLVKMRNTLDNRMKELSKQGIVHEQQQAQLITVEDEDKIWQTGLLGDDTPEKLLNMLLHLISVHFALRACDEHKALKVGA